MSEENFHAENFELDELFQHYRSACPDVEPGANFMPLLWRKIDSRRSLWFQLAHLGKNAIAVSAAICLLLLALNLAAPPQVAANYADALLAEDSAEQVFYTEALPPAPPEIKAAAQQRH